MDMAFIPCVKGHGGGDGGDCCCCCRRRCRRSACNFPSNEFIVGEPGTASFMLVMDKLTGNLHDKIQSWRKDWQKCRGKALGLWNRDKQGLDALYTERLLASFDIARALKHLHHHRILYRDIKVSLGQTFLCKSSCYLSVSHIHVPC